MTDAEPSGSPATTVDREAIRKQLADTRAGYHELLNSLSGEDWKKKSGNPAWNVGQLMWHLAWANGFIADGVKRCKTEKGFSPPRGIADFANTWMTRIGSLRASKHSVAEKYDATHKAAIEALNDVQDDEWGKGAKIFGEYQTVESTLRSAAEHFTEHEADIMRGLGRS